LNGATGSVTYSSSDESVATVNNDGSVVVKNGGTTTITATESVNKLYQSATASYVLTVNRYYTKVTSLTDLSTLESGTYLLVYNSEYALDPYSSSDRLKVSISDSKITRDDDTCEAEVKFEKNGDSGYYIKYINKGQYLARSSSSVEYGDNGTNHTITISSNAVQLSAGDYALRYSSSAFSYKSNGTSCSFALYLLEGSNKPSRNLQFAEESVEKEAGADDFTITLNGTTTNGQLEYSSSKESVATVTQAGLVHIVGEGTTVISASCVESDGYAAGSASFTLTVGKLYTYEKVDEPTSGATYIIVNRDNNMAMSATTSKAKQAVAPENDKIVSNALAGCEFVISATESAYTFKSVSSGKYILFNSSDPYYEFSDNKTEYILESGPKDSAEADTQFFYFYYKKSSDSSTSYYLYYDFSSSRQYFLFGNSGSKTGKKDDGSGDRFSGGINLYKKVVAE